MSITYILYPLITIIALLLGYIIAKKNNLMSNKRLIMYFFISILLLATPAILGLFDYKFMPYGYLVLSVLYLIVGFLNSKVLAWVLKSKPTYFIELTVYITTMILSMLLFSVVFNYCNELQYGLWASTSLLLYIVPCLYTKTNQLFLNIPIEIYNIWSFANSPDLGENDTVDYTQLIVVKIELFKSESDTTTTNINAKAPNDMQFGVWFKRLVTDYNIKSPNSPIEQYKGLKNSGWIFYTKKSFFLPRKYIDYNKTFKENKIGEQCTIVAKRVLEQPNQK